MPYVDPPGLRTVAGRFDSEVSKHLDEAISALKGAEPILSDNFTNVHLPLAIVYVEAHNFENTDLERKKTNATEFKNRLTKTANDWDAAEHASKPKTHD